MKQETLEEAAERIYPNEGYKDEAYCDLGEMSRELWLEGAKWQQEQHKIDTDDAYNEGFENGKNWQAERMYSEEELQQKIDAHLEVAKDLWLFTIKEQKKMYSEEEVWKLVNKLNETLNIGSDLTLEEWFEQFKK